MSGGYRDQGEALRARLASLDDALREREASAADDFWAERTVARRAALREPFATVARGAPVDELAAAIELRERRVAAYDAAREELEREFRKVKKRSPLLSHLASDRFADSVAQRTLSFRLEARARTFRALVTAVDPGAAIEQHGGWGLRATLIAHELPFTVVTNVDLGLSSDDDRERTLVGVGFALGVSVRRGTAKLKVSPGEVVTGWLARLLPTRDVVVGDERFDARFEIQGDPEAAKALLTPEIREVLLAMREAGSPTLETDPGLAVLTDDALPDDALFRRMLAAMASVRRAKATRRLFRAG